MSAVGSWTLPVRSGGFRDFLVTVEIACAAVIAWLVRDYSNSELAGIISFFAALVMLLAGDRIVFGVQVTVEPGAMLIRPTRAIRAGRSINLCAVSNVEVVTDSSVRLTILFANGERIDLGPWSRFHLGLTSKLTRLASAIRSATVVVTESHD